MFLITNYPKFKVLSPILKFKSAVLVVIENLPWLSDKDYLFTPIDSFDLKAKETLTECGGVSVFVSIAKGLSILINLKIIIIFNFVA